MRFVLVLLMLVACEACAQAESVPSPAGLADITVRGKARNVVVVDPLGRVDRSEKRAGEVPIPDCDRWDGGSQTMLNEKTGEDEEAASDVVTQIDLARPIMGRYSIYADVAGDAGVDVTLSKQSRANDACPNLERRVKSIHGRVRWTLEFVPVIGDSTCPVRMPKPTATKK